MQIKTKRQNLVYVCLLKYEKYTNAAYSDGQLTWESCPLLSLPTENMFVQYAFS